MTQILRIPKAAVSMREGTLVQWLVADGAVVSEGQPIFTLELEKSTMDVESPAAGVIRQTGQAGSTYKVGEIIGEIGEASAPVIAAPRTPADRFVQVVPDLERAMVEWYSLIGVGPFFVFPHLQFAEFSHRGSNRLPDISIAVGASGDLLIELVALHDDAPSPWAEAGTTNPLLSATTEVFDAAIAAHAAAGRQCIGLGRYAFGARFAFLDAGSGSARRLLLLEKNFVLSQLAEKIRNSARIWDRVSLTADLK